MIKEFDTSEEFTRILKSLSREEHKALEDLIDMLFFSNAGPEVVIPKFVDPGFFEKDMPNIYFEMREVRFFKMHLYIRVDRPARPTIKLNMLFEFPDHKSFLRDIEITKKSKKAEK